MQTQQRIEIVKIGGSILFNTRGELKTTQSKSLIETCKKIKARVIIVVGCGKNMHQRIISSNLTDKPKLDSSGIESSMSLRIEEFFINYKDIMKNIQDICALDKEKRLKPVHPTQILIKKSLGDTSSHEIEWFDQALFSGQGIPLTSGGVIFDRQILFSAISSDTVTAHLAVYFKASRIVLLTNTKGVYISPSERTTINKISLANTNKYQITGGMKDKLRRISKAVRLGIPVLIASGRSDLAHEVLVNKDLTNCTKIVK